MSLSEEFAAHLASGLTTLARCWRVAREDGVVFGFTDHDCALSFENTGFLADSGLTAAALEQGSGLGVDNTETLGALSADAITEEDIAAGRYDGAEVTCWLVNWADVSQRLVLFAGQIGEVTRSGGAFRAELRGLSEPLNQPVGRVYQKSCPGGVDGCAVDEADPAFRIAALVVSVQENMVFELDGAVAFDADWFTHGHLIHEGSGLRGVIKSDQVVDGQRVVELWTPIDVPVAIGDSMVLVAGHDRSFATARFKFDDVLNFRGFPDIPGDDWITHVPRKDGVNDGGSLR
ncbi:DUF2163 domain-containing protein [Cognatishimia activa]|uniref:Bacteriophage phiJL001 Gp84 C-terminal domain-containing protein n=1 Tax=Cognatishimia activa TaxID=1715691 RepID=A0A0N7MC14_9RHOB|nr:DUF2163 domain-containing protein [Cognatishimia activa]CUJ38354.1 hypothetical protein TA5113_03249 [Cognatishimia activa]CUK26936.1 hypothetical protein TA5114_02755 [Cognatishimia activa]